MLCLGIDSGTKSTKALVLDIESGEILALAQSAHRNIGGLPPGHIEQDPTIWIDAAETTVAECLEKVGDRRLEIKAIGVSGQQHGLVALDKANEPLRPAKLWCDVSAMEQCEEFNQEFGGSEGLIERIGNPMLPGYTAPKLLWLKENEPANFQRLTSILLPHDYLNLWLTGERQMEYGDASGTGLLDVRSRKWSTPTRKVDRSKEGLRRPLFQTSGRTIAKRAARKMGPRPMTPLSAPEAATHDERDPHRKHSHRRHDGQSLEPPEQSATFRGASDRSERRNRRLLRRDRSLAAAHLYHERGRCYGTGARTFQLGHSNDGGAGGIGAGRRGRDSFPPLFARRTHTQPAKCSCPRFTA